jgi:hypothetical protein
MQTPDLVLRLTLGSLTSRTALAEACYLITRSSSAAIPETDSLKPAARATGK